MVTIDMKDPMYRLKALPGRLEGSFHIRGSKSISNRLLIMQALAGVKATLKNLSTAKDTRRLSESLKMISDCSGSRIPLVVNADDAGTVMRFLTAYLAVREGLWLLTGNERMQERPVGELVKALQMLGADIDYTFQHGFPPLKIEGTSLHSAELEMDPSVSSQFVSALMMIAPRIPGGLVLHFSQKPVSFPYLKMTASLMKLYGVSCSLATNSITIPEGIYKPVPVGIEPDWSSAAFWYEMAAIHGDASIFLKGFEKESLQGDRVIADLFLRLGVETRFTDEGIRLLSTGSHADRLDHDFSDYPDLVPAVLATCAALGMKARLSGIAHLRFKESDRLAALQHELSKTGVSVQIDKDQLILEPGGKPAKGILEFETYKDHRMVMSLAPLAFQYNEVLLRDPLTVNKSYPEFWLHIQQTGRLAVDKNS
ncbi:MAG: 3-phosphoshikimate 1-carboxyvinyltransferase [bacterium]